MDFAQSAIDTAQAMVAHLTLYEDILSSGTRIRLPVAPRMVFVVRGSLSIGEQGLADEDTWHGCAAVNLEGGNRSGAMLWRFDLTDGPPTDALAGEGLRSSVKLTAPLTTLPEGELLFRGDSVAFPPGACAFTHVHQGPGIRCLIEGGIRIDTQGGSTAYGPGGAWFESGPDPVFAQAAADRTSRFIRVMILPRTLVGKSSIRYVNQADQDKPRSQIYKIFVDAPIGFSTSGTMNAVVDGEAGVR
ncbi:MAG: hypothetical protein JO094_08805 [Hyphomicrobiales bacterium]|nr:hypothetical protein [Hyphomicrobiales bacterium]